MMLKASDHIPPQVAAFIQYVFKLFPFKFKGGTNGIMAKDGRGAGAKFYRKHFPPGTTKKQELVTESILMSTKMSDH